MHGKEDKVTKYDHVNVAKSTNIASNIHKKLNMQNKEEVFHETRKPPYC
jgi:glutaredoxin-related protein